MPLGRKNHMAAFLFLTPSLLFFAIFFFFPLFFTIYLSFHQWDMLGDAVFIGFANYLSLMDDERFIKTLVNTFLFVGVTIVIMPALSLGVAILLNLVTFAAWFWRLLFFLPIVTSVVAMSLVWQYIFDPTYGPLNEILKFLGFTPRGWIMNPDESLVSVIILMLWQGVGYYAIIYLAGLQSIPEEYYEAARIDGANGWQQFFSITLPLLQPTTIFVFVMVAINSFQVFTQVFVLTNGGPVDSSNVLGLYIYQTAFEFLNMGKASSMAVILFLLVLGVSLFQLRMLRQQHLD